MYVDTHGNDNFAHPKDNEFVRKIIKPRDGVWIAGGACLAWYQNRACESDIDVYFDREESYVILRSEIIFGGPLGYVVTNTYETENAITFKLAKNDEKLDIQLIKKFYGSAKEVIDDFDITVCQIAWDGQKLWLGEHFAEDLASRRLRYDRFSPQSHKRLAKYMTYGFEPTPEDYAAMLNSPAINWNLQGTDHYAT